MKATALVINILALVCLLWAFFKDPSRARKSLEIACRSLWRILPMVLAIIVVIGLMLGFVPREFIARVVGEKAGLKGVLLVAPLGAVLYIPSLVSFPLAASLLECGASVTSVAVFITTLTMIGLVTLPLEIKELGRRLALWRNILSFLVAVVIGILMGLILGGGP